MGPSPGATPNVEMRVCGDGETLQEGAEDIKPAAKCRDPDSVRGGPVGEQPRGNEHPNDGDDANQCTD